MYRCEFCGLTDQEAEQYGMVVAPLTDDDTIVSCDEHVDQALSKLDRKRDFVVRRRCGMPGY